MSDCCESAFEPAAGCSFATIAVLFAFFVFSVPVSAPKVSSMLTRFTSGDFSLVAFASPAFWPFLSFFLFSFGVKSSTVKLSSSSGFIVTERE